MADAVTPCWGRAFGVDSPTLVWDADLPTSSAKTVTCPFEFVPQGIQTACDPAIYRIQKALGLSLDEDDDDIWSWGHTGLHLFPGARLLGGYLLSPVGKELVAGKTVLELGCGAGLLGLCCRAAGAAKAVLTDIDPLALNLCQHNQQLAESSFRCAFGQDADCMVSVRSLDWRRGPEEALLMNPDVVLATDVVYDSGLSSSLAEFLVALCKDRADTVVLLALQHRGSSDTTATLVEDWLGRFGCHATVTKTEKRERSRSPNRSKSPSGQFASKRLARLILDPAQGCWTGEGAEWLLRGRGGSEPPKASSGGPAPLLTPLELWRLQLC